MRCTTSRLTASPSRADGPMVTIRWGLAAS